jgi:Zn-dependent protease
MTSNALTCPRHPGVETLLSCTRCDRPACPDCLVQSPVGSQCAECVGSQRHEETRAVRAQAELMRPGRVFYGLVATFLGACAWTATIPLDVAFAPPAERIGPILVVILGWVVSLCLHEYAHAVVAYRCGDTSVPEKGYLTLDPRKYSDPFFSVVLPIVFLVAGGLGLPGGAVWIEQHRIRSRQQRSLVSLAGPAVNLVFGVIVLAIVQAGILDGTPTVKAAFAFLGLLEFATVFLNLIPIPGLDGFGAIEPYLPQSVRDLIAPIGTWSIFILIAVLLYTGAGQAIWDAGLWGTDLLGVDRTTIDLGQLLSDLRLLA